MDFEKNIGQELKEAFDNLKMSPDDTVWNKIEQELQRRKRRRFLLWLLPILLVIGGFIFYTINELKQEPQKTTNSQNKIKYKNSKQKHTNKVASTNGAHIQSMTKIPEYQNEIDNKSKHAFSKTNINFEKSSQKTSVIYPTATNKNRKEAKPIIRDNIRIIKNLSESSNSNSKNKYNSNEYVKNGNNRHTKEENIDHLEKEALENEEKKNDLINHNKNEDNFTQQKEKVKSQDSVEIQKNKWSITAQIIVSNYLAFNESTNDALTLNYGILGSYRINTKTFIRTGVRRLQLQHTTNNIRTKVKYLEFPLNIKYAPYETKFRPYVLGGISYFLLQDSNVTNTINRDYKTTFSLNGGLGIETKLLKKLYFNIETNLNYQIRPFDGQDPTNPFILSIQSGIEYRF